jgi:glycosyltransferase involved in cell wall biosynthesis
MGDRRPTVSALVIARDEAHNLPGCLEALAWVDERIVVVDPASRDATEAVARAHADRVIVRPFDNFASQRNAGRLEARGDWILAVDADERSSPAQGAEIRRCLGDPGRVEVGYRVPIRSVILGRRFGYSGTQLDRPLRLFERLRGRWVGAVHETVALDGAIGQIDAPLEHRTIETMEVFLRKLDRYTSLEAVKLRDERRPIRAGDLTFRPLATFLRLYLARQGFRDGREGFLFCALSAVSVAVRNWKYRELLRAEGTG